MTKSYYLTLEDRERIASHLKAGDSVYKIAKALKRGDTTIRREINRKAHPDDEYCPYKAHDIFMKSLDKFKSINISILRKSNILKFYIRD